MLKKYLVVNQSKCTGTDGKQFTVSTFIGTYINLNKKDYKLAISALTSIWASLLQRYPNDVRYQGSLVWVPTWCGEIIADCLEADMNLDEILKVLASHD